MTEMQFVVFKLNNEEYAIEINSVDGILKYQELTKVPQTDEFILGIINLRGKVIPIYNLKKKFYGEESEITDDTRIIIINHNEIILGVIVDSVAEVLKISDNDIDLTDSIFSDKKDNSISGIGKLKDRLLMIININELLSENEKTKIKEVI